MACWGLLGDVISSHMWSQERAAKWRTPDGLMDGLTTNGVLVMHPAGGFSEDSAPGVWREISVCGNVYTLRDSRSAQQRGKLVGGLLPLSPPPCHPSRGPPNLPVPLANPGDDLQSSCTREPQQAPSGGTCHLLHRGDQTSIPKDHPHTVGGPWGDGKWSTRKYTAVPSGLEDASNLKKSHPLMRVTLGPCVSSF